MTNWMIFIFGAIVVFLAFLIFWTINYFWKKSNRSEADSLTIGKFRQNGGAEKRQHPRFDVNWPVSIETAYGTIAATVKNISLGGAFIGCKKPFPIGHVFSLTMTAPNNEPVTATCGSRMVKCQCPGG